jgi:hypothetical protein
MVLMARGCVGGSKGDYMITFWSVNISPAISYPAAPRLRIVEQMKLGYLTLAR